MQMKMILCVSLLLGSLKSLAQNRPLLLPRLFANNMVLQQGTNVPVWGWAWPGEKVVVSVNGNQAFANAGADGKWELTLPVMTAGGPYEMQISTPREKKTLHNVMVGEVWLASGQSNMNYRAGVNARQQLPAGGYPQIREFYVPEQINGTPQTELKSGEWKICTPENVSAFSAVAFYFAKNLHITHHVAVGIIHASHGGTTLEGWLSQEALLSHPDFRERTLQAIENPQDWPANQRRYDSVNAQRAAIFNGASNGLKQGVQQPDYTPETKWAETPYPISARKLGVQPYTFIWLRKTVEVPAQATGRYFNMDLGPVESASSVAWFNGEQLNKGGWQIKRIDSIPARLVKPGKNVIAVLMIFGDSGGGGIGRDTDRPRLFTIDNSISMPLTGLWRYNDKLEAALPPAKSYNRQANVFYNGMLHPLLPFGIRGVLWYQGENNAGDHPAAQYQTLLPLLMSDWRTRFKQGYLPFIIAQLPNFKYAVEWANLREAQLKALNYPATGLAVTIDQGDPENVHPREKAEVGRRMFLAAERVAYHNEKLVYSGPLYAGYSISGDTVTVKFASIGSGLTAKNNNHLLGFEIAGADHHFVPATALISGSVIKVFNPAVRQPLSVRYAWAQNPVFNLYNLEGVPASPFRTDNW